MQYFSIFDYFPIARERFNHLDRVATYKPTKQPTKPLTKIPNTEPIQISSGQEGIWNLEFGNYDSVYRTAPDKAS